MFDPKNFEKSLFSITDSAFESAALELFGYQWENNPIYHHYCNLLNRNPGNTHQTRDIPFLPISFFKSHIIKTGSWTEEKIYLSSGTTGDRSKHFVKNDQTYLQLAQNIFEGRFGSLDDYVILALLPSYQQQNNSSLISMVDHFIHQSAKGSGYLLEDDSGLLKVLTRSGQKKICLFGVSYALLDFAEKHSLSLPNVLIIETGGMKGRRHEIIRADLHRSLYQRLKPREIHSEYGMSELTSQAYSEGEHFKFPPWARVLTRDINDPFAFTRLGLTGGLNIIDLGNIHSCAFIETKDLGRLHSGGSFEVIGRYDNSDIRGCNLLV